MLTQADAAAAFAPLGNSPTLIIPTTPPPIRASGLTQLAGDVVPLQIQPNMSVDELYSRILSSPSGMAKIGQMGGLKTMPPNVAVTPQAFQNYLRMGGK